MGKVWKRARAALCGGAALSVWSMAQAQADRVPVIQAEVGNWSILGYNDANPMCGAVISDGTNSFIFDYLPRDGYALNLMDDTGRWHPVDGQAYVLSATLTGKVPIMMRGIGWQNRVVMLLGHDDSALGPFRRGGTLAFETDAQRFEIDLGRSGEALSALRDCVKQIFGN